jgi:hypothetical protein
MKHTPGPWEWDENFIVAPDPSGKHPDIYIAEIASEDEEGRVASDKEQTANARLIAAAPRMFQELQDSLRWLREHAKYMSNEVREGYTATCDGLEATIESIHPKKGTK